MLRYSGSTIGAGVVTEVSLGFYVMRETDETASIHTQLAHNLLILYMQILCLQFAEFVCLLVCCCFLFFLKKRYDLRITCLNSLKKFVSCQHVYIYVNHKVIKSTNLS